ncbi:MAG TPA: helix-turn-helix domain-containing protein [Blastocatellia bacterium]|jgi:hypothetical protein|nr:helix-turn-helix domain-containing protein [Blastocatellia bacterium]
MTHPVEEIIERYAQERLALVPYASMYDEKEAAVILGITRSTLWRWRKDGRINCEKGPFGVNRIMYSRTQLWAVLVAEKMHEICHHRKRGAHTAEGKYLKGAFFDWFYKAAIRLDARLLLDGKEPLLPKSLARTYGREMADACLKEIITEAERLQLLNREHGIIKLPSPPDENWPESLIVT